eukprot:scaffold1741_cov409-Prasinococcus_capsulatus_cf.AAC.10
MAIRLRSALRALIALCPRLAGLKACFRGPGVPRAVPRACFSSGRRCSSCCLSMDKLTCCGGGRWKNTRDKPLLSRAARSRRQAPAALASARSRSRQDPSRSSHLPPASEHATSGGVLA